MFAPDILKFEVCKSAGDMEAILKRQGYDEIKLKERMYRRGYLPVLDIPPFMVHSFNQEKGTFDYTIIMYGAKCEEDIENYEGWLTGEWIRSSIKTKSDRLLNL
jgi:hypothetical protein